MGSLLQDVKDTGEQLDWSPLGIATAQVSKLKRAALAGDVEAARALVSIAENATSALVWIWEGYDSGLASPDFEKLREPKREILRQIAKKRETWPVLYHCREVKRKDIASMVKELALGTATPLKAIRVKDDHMRHLIEVLSYEIGVPQRRAIKEWAEKAVACIETNWPQDVIRNPKTWLYNITNPKRQVKRKNTKQIERLTGELKRLLKNGDDTIAGDAKIQKIRDEIGKKKARWEEGETAADPHKLLKEAIVARLKAILPRRPQM